MLKRILGYGLLAVLCLGGGIFLGAWFFQEKITSIVAQPSEGCANLAEKNSSNFYDVQNILISLKNSQLNKRQRYVVLDLSLVSRSDLSTQELAKVTRLVKSATVNLLTNKPYDEVNQLDIKTLQQQLLHEYFREFAELNIPVPFFNVLISRIVFQ